MYSYSYYCSLSRVYIQLAFVSTVMESPDGNIRWYIGWRCTQETFSGWDIDMYPIIEKCMWLLGHSQHLHHLF